VGRRRWLRAGGPCQPDAAAGAGGPEGIAVSHQRPGGAAAAEGTRGRLLDGRLPTGCLETRAIRGRRKGASPGSIQRAGLRQAVRPPGTSRRSPPVRSRSPGRSKMRLPSMSAARHAVTLSDTRRHGERAHCRRYGARPGRRGWLCEPHANGRSVAPANRRACSRCWPGPGGPEGRWAAEPVMPEPTGQDPDVVGKLQLATVESRVYFLEIHC